MLKNISAHLDGIRSAAREGVFLRRLSLVFAAAVLAACSGGGSSPPAPGPSADAQLAAAIRADARLPQVRAKARALIAKGMNAGSGYAEVYIRDLNTFMDLAVEALGGTPVRAQLRLFLERQGADGNIADAFTVPGDAILKNTVESDQESSLVQAVARYVALTGDTAFLNENVRGLSVIERLENALNFLYTQRYSERHGLVWGGTRADWGDVQPEDEHGTNLNELSHPSISIYDNAMLSLALADLVTLETRLGRPAGAWALRAQNLRVAVRTYLWDGAKFIPHLYLDKGSPFPASFNEAQMYFTGGTAVAIQAGLLEPAEAAASFARMVKNKNEANATSIGLALWPSYPAGFFKNTEWMGPEYFYQNGGDWPWFGARIVQQMTLRGQVQDAYRELGPMLDRIVRDDAFYEWYTRSGAPRGSNEYRGTAGQMARAIDMLLEWAARN